MDETLRRKAYLEGLKLKNSGLDEEIIYARLEKQGIPPELAKEVAKNVLMERKKIQQKEHQTNYNIALIKIGLGIAAAILSAILLPGVVILPVGLILGGIIYAIVTNNKMNE